MFARDTPQIHSGVSAPGPPCFGTALKLAGVIHAESPQKPQIAGGQCIRLSQSPHGNVLRRPPSNTRNLAQPGQKTVSIYNSFKIDLAIANSAGQRADCLRSRSGQAHAGQIGCCQYFFGRKKMSQVIVGTEWPSEGLSDPAG